MTHPRRRILGRFACPAAALAIATALAGCAMYPFQPEYAGNRDGDYAGARNSAENDAFRSGDGGYSADRGEARSEWGSGPAR